MNFNHVSAKCPVFFSNIFLCFLIFFFYRGKILRNNSYFKFFVQTVQGQLARLRDVCTYSIFQFAFLVPVVKGASG